MNADILATIRQELKAQANQKTRETQQRFFKEAVSFYGLTNPTVEKLARQHFPEVKPLGKQAIFALCEELLKSGYFEESLIAFEWSYRLEKEYEPEDFSIFESWIEKYVSNWAACDALCNHTVSALIEKYPQFIENLKQWAKSENRWFRRAAAVTLVLPARNGKFLPDIIKIADILLADSDDLVQKGYGWMLKEAGKTHQEEVFNYVMKNKKVMPRTALRYAIEKMPPDLKRRAMEK